MEKISKNSHLKRKLRKNAGLAVEISEKTDKINSKEAEESPMFCGKVPWERESEADTEE